MGDDITIGVTEIVNNIEVTAQPNDQQIDISVIDNADEVTLNVTPTVVEVNVNRGSSYARWGTIYGTLGDQTDLANALLLKADLVGGLVPAYQLPSFVDDVIEVANYAALPTVGETGKIYLTLDNNKIYRWSGSVYVEIASNQAIWGSITGTLSAQTDLVSALNAKVPTARTLTINGTTYDLSADRSWTISGATWGSITGTLSSQTDLQSALDAKVPTARTLTINGTAYDLSADRSWTISGLPSMLEYNDTDKTVWNNGKANIVTNTSFGDGALKSLSTGSGSTVYGYQALYLTTSSAENTAMGNRSLYNNSSGNQNTALGAISLNGNQTGSNNVSVGAYSGLTWQNISNSVFIGHSTSASADNQTNTIVIGYGAIGNGTNSVTLGSTSITRTFLQGDVLVGVTAGVRRLTVNDSAGFYSGAFSGGTSGNYVGLGVKSTVPVIQGFLNTNNVADLALQPDGGNVGIGTTNPVRLLNVAAAGSVTQQFVITDTGYSASGKHWYMQSSGGQFYLGNATNSSGSYASLADRITITSGGNVGIGTTNPTALLHINGILNLGTSASIQGQFSLFSTTANAEANFYGRNGGGLLINTNANAHPIEIAGSRVIINTLGTGLVYSNSGTLTSTNPSDERLKDEITDLPYGLNEIIQLRPVTYLWKNDTINQGKQFGFIAQEVQEVMPELVKEFETKDGEEDVIRLGLDKEAIFVAMVNAIKELKAEIELLKAK